MNDSSTPYDNALDRREQEAKDIATTSDALIEHVAGFLWTASKDPAPPRNDIKQWLRGDGEVEWNGTYARSAGSELRRWLEWMENRSLTIDDVERSGERYLERYAERLRERVGAGSIAGSTAHSYFAYIRSALEWMVQRGHISTNPAKKATVEDALPDDTSSRSEQQFWTLAQREQLLDAISDRTAAAVEANPRGETARQALRDRVLVGLLYFSAARVTEVARRSDDQRRGRDGIRWSDLDLEAGTMTILGKDEQERIQHTISDRVVDDLRRYRTAQAPPSDEWPVFPTGHAPSLWAAAREQLSEADNVSGDVYERIEEAGGIHAALREYDVTPPAITDAGVRTRLRNLCETAGIEVDDEHGYLVPQGARRGAIAEVYRRDRRDALNLGRHFDLSTIDDAYGHVDIERQRERFDSHFKAIDEQ